MAAQGNAKPYLSVPLVDWSNPLTYGLIGCYLPGTLYGNAVVGPDLAMGDGGAGSGDMIKEGYAYSSVTSASNKGLIAPAPAALTGSAFSCYWRGVLVGNADDFTTLIGVTYTNSDSNPFYGRMLAFDQAGAIANIATHWNTGGTLTNGTNFDTTSLRGAPIGICGTFLTGGNAILYVNGTSRASDAFGASDPTSSGPQVLINQWLPGTPRTPNARCSLALFWNRQLSASEVLQIDENPHQFLIFPEEDLVAGAAGAVAAVRPTRTMTGVGP